MYLYLAPYIFKLQHMGEGRIPPYPTFLDDVLLCRSVFFFSSIGLSLCLWSVKASLLSLYRRLLEGGARIFLIVWWIVVGICVLVGCLESASSRRRVAPVSPADSSREQIDLHSHRHSRHHVVRERRRLVHGRPMRRFLATQRPGDEHLALHGDCLRSLYRFAEYVTPVGPAQVSLDGVRT